MRTSRKWHLTGRLLAAGLIAALALSGCGDGSDTAGSRADQGVAEPLGAVPADGGAPAQGGNAAEGGNTAAKAPEKLVPDARAIIYTGTVTVRVSDVDAAANQASTLAVSAGGFVGGDNRTADKDRAEARLVLRVPSEKFAAVVGDVGKLGEEVKREVSTQDVTEQLVDIESRVATATASVERVRALLARAQTIGEIVSLESEVARREAELESLKARQRKLADLAALSTVTVVLVGKETPLEPGDDEETGFLAGLKGGWKAFTASLEIMLTVLGALLPWLLAIGLPVLLLVTLLRRSAARRGPPMALAPAGAAPPVPAPPARPEPPTSAPPAM